MSRRIEREVVRITRLPASRETEVVWHEVEYRRIWPFRERVVDIQRMVARGNVTIFYYYPDGAFVSAGVSLWLHDQIKAWEWQQEERPQAGLAS